MAEKRKFTARGREPTAKRRVAEATPHPQQSSKKKASIAVHVLPTPLPKIERSLPTKIKDGEGLPITREPQLPNLPETEYRSIAESAVLLLSLERSKKRWVSDGLLERYWTKPKKAKREQIEKSNPPKESMTKVGPCNIIIGPHLFDAILYTVKEPNAQSQTLQYIPPQRPIGHYNNQNNFLQYQPYPQSPAPARAGPTYTPQNPHSQPSQQTAGQPPPLSQHKSLPHYPPHVTSQPPRTPRTHRSPLQQPPQPSKPTADPVIQMLATKAATDPDLKALMRIVASSKASQDQLRAFQAHIDELTAIIKAREREQHPQPGQTAPSRHDAQPKGRSQNHQTTQKLPHQEIESGGPPSVQRASEQALEQTRRESETITKPQGQKKKSTNTFQVPANDKTPGVPSTQPQAQPTISGQENIQKTGACSAVANALSSRSNQTSPPQSKVANAAMTIAPPSTLGPSSTPNQNSVRSQTQPSVYNSQQTVGYCTSQPHANYRPASNHTSSPPMPPRPQQRPSALHHRPAVPTPSFKTNYKSVVLEFTSPLTPYGSSTSGHAGSGDRYLFPEYSILEWFPGGTSVIASFLIVRKVDPNKPFPIETDPGLASTRNKAKSSKSKKADKNKDKSTEISKDNALPDHDPGEEDASMLKDSHEETRDMASVAATFSNPNVTANEDLTSSTDTKEYYQPVTFRIISHNPNILEPLSRVVKSPDEVRRYMNEVMDRAERAPEGFLAFRLPREKALADDSETDMERKKLRTLVSGNSLAASSRNKRSKSRIIDDGEDSAFERSDADKYEEDEEEEELMDFYGPPTGLVPFGV